MKRARATNWQRALLVVVGMSLPTTYALAAKNNMDVLKKMQTAKTAADYEALASYFDSQAAKAKEKADMHRKMADTYTSGGTPIGKGVPAPLPEHCLALAKTFDEEAAHDTAMAETYRQLAKTLKK
jgi:hypothetical protein